jgi:hypothetical protein
LFLLFYQKLIFPEDKTLHYKLGEKVYIKKKNFNEKFQNNNLYKYVGTVLSWRYHLIFLRELEKKLMFTSDDNTLCKCVAPSYSGTSQNEAYVQLHAYLI